MFRVVGVVGKELAYIDFMLTLKIEPTGVPIFYVKIFY